MKSIAILFTGLSLTLTSCMHVMMMEGHSNHGEAAASKVTKEVITNDVTLTINIEPMTVRTESNIIVSVSSSSHPVDSIYLHYMISQKSTPENNSAHNHGTSSASPDEFKTIHQNITMSNGKLSIPFTPTVAGEFVFSITTDLFSSEATFTVVEKKSLGMGSMMGVSPEYWYLGAIAMAGMMVIMWTVKGGIF